MEDPTAFAFLLPEIPNVEDCVFCVNSPATMLVVVATLGRIGLSHIRTAAGITASIQATQLHLISPFRVDTLAKQCVRSFSATLRTATWLVPPYPLWWCCHGWLC